MTDCTHEAIYQLSSATLRTMWTRSDDGSYDPDDTPDVLGEDTEWFECVDCGEGVSLGENQHLEVD